MALGLESLLIPAGVGLLGFLSGREADKSSQQAVAAQNALTREQLAIATQPQELPGGDVVSIGGTELGGASSAIFDQLRRNQLGSAEFAGQAGDLAGRQLGEFQPQRSLNLSLEGARGVVEGDTAAIFNNALNKAAELDVRTAGGTTNFGRNLAATANKLSETRQGGEQQAIDLFLRGQQADRATTVGTAGDLAGLGQAGQIAIPGTTPINPAAVSQAVAPFGQDVAVGVSPAASGANALMQAIMSFQGAQDKEANRALIMRLGNQGAFSSSPG